jgi:hypothetical protein
VQGSQLVIKDSSITGFKVKVNGALLVGGAVAVVKSKCDFDNVDVSAEFNINEFGSSGIIGGFAAQTQDQGTGTTFTDCDVTVEMNIGSCSNNIGGFVGSIGSVSQFYNCTVAGSIDIKNGAFGYRCNKVIFCFFRDLSCIVCRVIVYEEVNTDYCVMNIIGNISYSSILER